MTPLVVDVGWVGSPIDVATFIALMVIYRHELEPRIKAMGAGIVALANLESGVDHERLAADLDADEQEVDALLRAARTDGAGEDEQ